MKRLISSLFIAVVFPIATVEAAGVGNDPPPIYVPGARAVDLRNTSGYLARYTTIPGNSLFATTGGSGQPCSFVAGGPGTTSNGQQYVAGQTVTSDGWIFEEAEIVSYGDRAVVNPNLSRGPLNTAFRQFMVFCDTRQHLISYLLVYPSDPMLNPHTQLTTLYNGLQLTPATIFRNPVVDKWGGLITRYPAWLAINPAAWQPHQSNPVVWRGWLMYLYATPLALDFHLVFTPAPDEPSPAFDGIVRCIARGAPAVADRSAVPAFPVLADHTTPGVNGPCMWTPPGPGRVSIEARITYRVLFWANGYTEPLNDYVWTSAPASFQTGELSSVNTNG